MIQCIFFAMYFAIWFVVGEDLPDWIMVLNTFGLALSTILAIAQWEHYKNRIEKLEKEIENLQEKDDGRTN